MLYTGAIKGQRKFSCYMEIVVLYDFCLFVI